MQIMLSELQQKNVWDGWLAAETRANYFADMSHRYQRAQRIITWSTLAASSGATAAVLAELPAGWTWIRLGLTLTTAGLSLWSLVANFNKNGTDCSDLHFRWHKLAIDFESLWGDMYSKAAHQRLSEFRERDAELSKSSTAFPNREALMRKWQRYIVSQHTAPATQ